MSRFTALLLSKGDAAAGPAPNAAFTELGVDDLMAGDVVVRVSHSTVNYKDGLAITGKGPVVRRWPMIPGIDFAGRVVASTHSGINVGDDVILNGWGVGEVHYGGYSPYARVKGDWLVRRPVRFTPAQAMAIGTAGYTAMLCVMALEAHEVAPSSGPVLVTGAAGGVGSVSVSLLASLGYHVIASTGRASEESYLKGLGAREIIARDELAAPGRPLGKERWAGAIDVAGSHTLANAIAQTKYGGCVASTGLAQGMDLPGSVAPFILRGITLAGVDSVMAPLARRQRAWQRLADHLNLDHLAAATTHRPLSDVVQVATELMAGKVRGRVVIEAP
jgi:acrylyl-CoA reductase (NADPH)